MRHPTKRPLSFLVLGILSLVALVATIYFFPPNFSITLFSLQIPLFPFFFCLLFLFLFATSTYLFNSKKHGLLIALFVPTYLLFRLNNLTHPFFFILLIALFLTVELLFSYRKE